MEKAALRIFNEPTSSRSEAYLSGLVEHQIASGSPSLLEQACQLSGEETLDILVWMLGKCPLLNFQKMAEENSAKFLSAAGQSPNSRMVEKLLRSELVPKDEGIKFCRENGYDDLLHRLDCNSLLVMTRAHSILATRSAE